MRTDAKIGVMCALIVGLVAGGYFTFRGSDEEPISLGAAPVTDASDPPATRPRPPITKKSPARADRSGTPGRRQAGLRSPADSKKTRTEKTTPQRIVGRDAAKTDHGVGQNPSGSSSLPLTGLTGGWSPTGSASADPNVGSRDPRTGAGQVGDAGQPSKPDLVGATTPGLGSREPRTPVRDSRTSSPSRKNRSAGGRNETHTVQDGDTFSSLSMQYYGDERHIQDLIRANPRIPNPDVLKIGAVLQIPQLGNIAAAKGPVRGERRAKSATSSAGRTYVVQSGDSLYKIARDELGDPLRWQELFELNRPTIGDNPGSLATGAVLVLPTK